MRTIGVLGLAMFGLAILTGCASGHSGKWVLDRMEPGDASGDYHFASITLNEDGTYAAEREVDGAREVSTGTYTMKDGKLTFTTAEGSEIAYDAKLTDANRTLEVTADAHGERVRTWMKRASQ